MNTLEVVNIKCGGCEKKIKDSLQQAGISDVQIDLEQQKVSFEGDVSKATNILNSLGYPLAGSPEAKSLMKKAKSYVSCMIGRTK